MALGHPWGVAGAVTGGVIIGTGSEWQGLPYHVREKGQNRRVGAGMASQLAEEGHEVVILDTRTESFRRLGGRGRLYSGLYRLLLLAPLMALGPALATTMVGRTKGSRMAERKVRLPRKR